MLRKDPASLLLQKEHLGREDTTVADKHGDKGALGE